MRTTKGGDVHTGAEQWMPLLADRGTVLALSLLALVLAGMLAAGLGGLTVRARV